MNIQQHPKKNICNICDLEKRNCPIFIWPEGNESNPTHEDFNACQDCLIKAMEILLTLKKHISVDDASMKIKK